MASKNDGKNLEHFISVAEEMLTPKGFEVEVRNRTYSDAGDQLAEFDLIVRGNFGSEQCLG